MGSGHQVNDGFFFASTIFFGLWVLRLLRVNDRLRRRDPWELAWDRFEKRQIRDRHPSA